MAELNEKLTGVPIAVGYTIFGEFGQISSFTAFANGAAADAARNAQLTDPTWLPKFASGAKFVEAGTAICRQLTKIA